MKNYIVLLFFFGSLQLHAQEKDFDWMGKYKFVYPSWWEEVSICFPDSLDTEDKMVDYLLQVYGSDVGDSSNWKEVMKHWYFFEKLKDPFPVFLGHCYAAGGEWDQAIGLFEDLYKLIPNDSLAEWHHCHLAYIIGQTYVKKGSKEEAIRWFGKASAPKFMDSPDEVIRYYARKSEECIEALKP